ncbi:MAG: PD-(D/E)XK nuclease family protein [Holosporaceae bacterium]|jgi:ATP-dependent helicase/nuclease subunit B|nr:PD-(D/E)XK nuclease family protein [Holosporaceae bacterium]
MSVVYRIHPSCDFLKEAAEIILSRKDLQNCTVLLPNRRSVRDLKRRLTAAAGTTFLPKLKAASDFFSFDDKKSILALSEFLKKKKPDVPFGVLCELSESLCTLINELVLNKVDVKQLTSLVPEKLQEYWGHTAAIIDTAGEISQIETKLKIIREKSEIFLKSTREIIAVNIGEINCYAKMFLKRARESGGIIETAEASGELPQPQFAEFNSVFEEGFAVAVAMEEAVREGKSVLAVCRDIKLSEIIKSELRRRNIIADDSRGTPFSKTEDGMVVTLATDMAERRCDCVSVLNFLKADSRFRETAVKLEAYFRRQKSTPLNFFEALDLIPEGDISMPPSFSEDFSVAVGRIKELHRDCRETRSLAEWSDLCCNLVATISPESVRQLRDVAPELFCRPDGLSVEITVKEFGVFLKNRVMSRSVRKVAGYTPNVAVLGAIEAQSADADLIIIAGAEEESWTESVGKNDFWMTASMLKHFGINSSESKNEFLGKIFERLTSKKNVLITVTTTADREKRRRYRRLEKIAENRGIIKADRLLKLTRALRKPPRFEPMQFTNPDPPLHLRPRRMRVTDLDSLIRNPYVFYAKNILRLRPENRINEAGRGNFLHKVLEEFVRYGRDLGSVDELWNVARRVMEKQRLKPADFGLWFFRLNRIFSFAADKIGPGRHYPEVCGDFSLRISEDCEINIRGRADRIDEDGQGRISIIDYKTGAVIPTKKSVEEGRHPQLPTEALIALNGGFAAAGIRATAIESLCFWQLTGSQSGMKIVSVDKVEESCRNTMEILKDIMFRHNVNGEPYAVKDSDYPPHEEPYMHLARIQETKDVR